MSDTNTLELNAQTTETASEPTTEATPTKTPKPKEKSVKSVLTPPKPKKPAPAPKAKAAPPPPAKKEGGKRSAPLAEAIEKSLLSFMRKGKEYTSRELVEGLGREPGAKGGDPVIRVLKLLVERKMVRHASAEGKKGFCWTKV